MKQLKAITAMVMAVLLMASPAAFAVTDTAAINVSASVASNFDLTLNIFEFENDTIGPSATQMSFGTLADFSPAVGTLNSVNSGTAAFVVFATAVANDAALTTPYTITLTGTAMTRTGGSETLPNASLRFTPVYNTADNGGVANDGTLGSATSWVGTNVPVYTSAASRPTRTVQVYHAITNVPTSQTSGAYTGTITYTLTAS